MNYQILLSKQVQKFLKTQEKKVLVQVKECFEKMSNNPHDPMLDTKVLSGMENVYRLRIRRMRFLYTFLEDTIVILIFKAGYRGGIYK